jgi:hypothetical protein
MQPGATKKSILSTLPKKCLGLNKCIARNKEGSLPSGIHRHNTSQLERTDGFF